MFDSFTKSSLWLRTLGDDTRDNDYESRIFLRTAFLSFRELASQLTSEIGADLPTFTEHGSTHLDALWGVAATIIGDTFPINPAEAFVLGGAFLIHDAAMTIRAYPRGIAQLKEDANYEDYVNKFTGQSVAQGLQSDQSAIERDAISQILRLRHADQAKRLAKESWLDPVSGNALFLIENSQLRLAYGSTIGDIAASHWENIQALRTLFPSSIGPASAFGNSWSVDRLKLALIMRCADAAHIDSKRSPVFLRSSRGLSGISLNHWEFQARLNQCFREGEYLVFSSGSPFPKSQIEAWWICYETLQMIHHEITSSNEMLASTGRLNLAARSVANVSSPTLMTERIGVDGWSPVDARVHIGNIPQLIARLGGAALYGDDPRIAIRELIQNAADAVRARKADEGSHPSSPGTITVAFDDEGGKTWLTVSDDGIGMSETAIRQYLLNFGGSYWGSELMIQEHPGLQARLPAQTGRYGIGFFSTFMVGRNVSVQSRPYMDGANATRVLEFSSGITTRPIFRNASDFERRRQGTTSIRIEVDHKRIGPGGSYVIDGLVPLNAHEMVLTMAPCLDCDIRIQVNGVLVYHQPANHWINCDNLELLRLTRQGVGSPNQPLPDEALQRLAPFVTSMVTDDGKTVGRGVLRGAFDLREYPSGYSGCVVVGGLRSARLYTFLGFLVGESAVAARDKATIDIPSESIANWSTQQARLVLESSLLSVETKIGIAASVARHGGDVLDLPVAKDLQRAYRSDELEEYFSTRSTVLIASLAEVRDTALFNGRIALLPNVLLSELTMTGIFGTNPDEVVQSKSPLLNTPFQFPLMTRGLFCHAATAMCRAWGLDAMRLDRYFVKFQFTKSIIKRMSITEDVGFGTIKSTTFTFDKNYLSDAIRTM